MTVLLIICIFASFILGWILGRNRTNKSASGDLIVSFDEDGTYLSVVLETPVSEITSKKDITFRIKLNTINTQK